MNVNAKKQAWRTAVILFGLTLLICLTLVLSASSATYTANCGANGDNVTWKLDTSTGVLAISGEGAMKNYTSASSVPWYSYRNSVKSVTVSEGVTSISDYAFYFSYNLTSVTIPESVTSIGNNAFAYCSRLTGVYISDIASWCGISFGSSYGNPVSYAKKLYLDGELVKDLEIPGYVTSVSQYALAYCTGLTSITFKSGVTEIYDSANTVPAAVAIHGYPGSTAEAYATK